MTAIAIPAPRPPQKFTILDSCPFFLWVRQKGEDMVDCDHTYYTPEL
jgi:hypothetical protein